MSDLKEITKAAYINRIKRLLGNNTAKLTRNKSISPQYKASLGGQNTILKRELEFLRTHKIVNDEKIN